MSKEARMRPIPFSQGRVWIAGVILQVCCLPVPGLSNDQADEAVQLKIIDPLASTRTIEDIQQAEDLGTVLLVGPQNGYASGQVVVMGHCPSNATISKLEGPEGQIGPDAVRIRYARKANAVAATFMISADSDKSIVTPYYDVLYDFPDVDAQIQPVWITIRIPQDAKPGEYHGVLSIGPHEVPVKLRVCLWRCPEPSEWLTHVGILSSPETLARHYGVPLWSEAHWRLVEKELEFLGGLGNDDLWLSVFSNNYMGQEVSWISFSEQSGAYSPDLGIASRYLDLYSRHVGRPHALLLDIWNSVRCSGAAARGEGEIEILVNGARQNVPLPGIAGSEKVWKPLLDALAAEVRKRGWPENTIILGCADDIRPSKKVADFFKEIAPYARWAIWTHGRGDPPASQGKLVLEGVEIAHYEHFYCPKVSDPRESGIVGGWDMTFPEYTSIRNWLPQYAPLTQYRSLAEGTVVNTLQPPWNMSRSSAGFSRLAMDFWPVPIGESCLANRSLLLAYEQQPWEKFFRNNVRSIIEPGPEGPLGTVRYEMVREGLQECQARITIEKALVAGKLSADVEKRCRSLLLQRLNARQADGKFKGGHPGNVLGGEEYLWGVPASWQESTAELFDLAGLVTQVDQ